ncbi:phage FluMu protein Com [Staphylococcus epidermidis]|mgnify:CR=1 FL=1
MEIYPSPRVLVVGKGSGAGVSESMFGRIFVYTHKSLLKYSDKFDDIVLVDEAYTSVKCPKCSFVHKKIESITIILNVNLVAMKTQTTTS